MKIAFHGAAQTVTGSQHLISIHDRHILLDCGLYQGPRRASFERNRNFPFSPHRIDSVILSHAHIDHSGNLPNLVRKGFGGQIHATHATAHLSDIMLRDSGHIQEADAAWLNKKKAKRGEPLIEPLYTEAHAAQVAQHFVHQEYDVPFEVGPGIRATLVDAGHILGSAGIILDVEEIGQRLRLMFSGDIGRRELPIIRDPVLPEEVDILLMESTYGDRSHNPPDEAADEFIDVVRRTVKRVGKVIIPAFAVGRTQTLVYYLHLMIEGGEIPEIPVFVDSPLAVNVTDIFRAHPKCFDQETLDFMRTDPHCTVFGFDHLTYTRSVEESKAINKLDQPMVIISASGMAEVGRILHHLRNNIEDPRNAIVITSWMAPHTLGRRLVEGHKEVKIFVEYHEVNAEVACINGLSAHADQRFLLEYACATQGQLKKLFLVHGEQNAAGALIEAIGENGVHDIAYPELDQEIEL